ncbi:MAG TPA: metalloregulator ArsR/SmtB family transcription factor [Acidimicrobiales bacterium]|nr:metalloregulator ArsR/SmtB family transcription factor [Acidimicrobiales bacterium]
MTDHGHPVDPERVSTARAEAIPDVEAQVIGASLSLLVDPLRARILSALLATDEMCVGDIALALDASEDSVSYALRLLRTAGLVHRRREGRMGYYRLRHGDTRPALEAVLARLRDLAALHPEAGADDSDDAS